MNRVLRVVTLVSVLTVAACGGETGSTSTPTTPPSTATTSSEPTTTSTLPPMAGEGWVTLGPNGLRTEDGSVLWQTSVVSWQTLARDGLGGFVFVDESGLWWLERGSNGPRMVADVFDDLIEVVIADGEPVARLGYCNPRYIGLRDGSDVNPGPQGRVEIDCSQEGFSTRWTAANGVTVEMVGPDFTVDAEGQVDEVLVVAHLVVTHDDRELLRAPIGGFYETWARIHDFDGRRVIVSRGPFEPAVPEETFFLIDLATGEVEFLPVTAATTAVFRGLDVTDVPVVVEPRIIYPGTPLLTDNLVVELEDGRYLGFIDHVANVGLTGGPEVHLDLAVWFSGKEADYAAAADGWTDIPVPNDYYIRNQDPTVLVRTVHPEVEVTSVWYHNDADSSLESRPITFEEFVDAMTGEPVGAQLNMWHDPWWITIVDNQIVAIDEQYVP